MSLNFTAAWLAAKRSASLLCFARTVTTSSVGLFGAGGVDGDGYPIPVNGRSMKLSVYDGSTVRSSELNVEIEAGDRISLYATYIDPTFTVSMRKNGATTPLQVSGCDASTTLQASLLLQLEDAS
ncbi:hypothetical protein K8I28_16035 [bacterium]|nr:hypothetical protein [bacterium]